MQRPLVVALIALAGCNGAANEAPVRFGEPAEPAELTAALRTVGTLPPAARGAALVDAIAIRCGPDCACLVISTCPAANPTVPPAWPSLELAGRYLAAELTAAPPSAGPALLEAVTALAIPIPRIELATARLAPATHSRALSPAAVLLGLDARATLSEGALPLVRFDARGARLEAPAPPTTTVDPGRYAPAPPGSATGATAPSTIGTGRYRAPDGTTYARREVVVQVGAALADGAPLIAADRDARALALIELLDARPGAIAIVHDGQAGELPLAIDRTPLPPAAAASTLVRTAASISFDRPGGHRGWRLEPDGRYDRPAVARGLAAVLTTRGTRVVIEVHDGTVAQLVDLIELALDAGATTLQLAAVEHGPFPVATRATPTVQIATPTVTGEVPPYAARRHLKRRRPQLLYCYEQRLLTTTGLAGDVKVMFIVGTDGHVTRSEAHGFDDAVDACLASIVHQLALPAQSIPSKVEVVLTFSEDPAP